MLESDAIAIELAILERQTYERIERRRKEQQLGLLWIDLVDVRGPLEGQEGTQAEA